MDLMHPQLAAFLAVLDEGTFDAAANRLSVTPSPISQRIKALEDRLGHVLVVRQLPCRPTPAGERLLRRVRPMETLEAEAIAEFDRAPGEGGVLAQRIPLAVNDDSVQTWFLSAMATLHHKHAFLFDLRVDDQDHTVELLRSGAVLGAVTSLSKAIQGCNVVPLVTMRYHAIASPEFARRHFPCKPDAASLANAPLIVFNRKDELQWRYIRRITRAKLSPPVHYLPTTSGFVEAAALGLGWCMAPDAVIAPAVKAGRVVVIDKSQSLDVPLYWQYAAVRSETLRQVTDTLRHAAARSLNGD